MILPEQATVGMPVRVRQHPVVVAGVSYERPRPVEGIIQDLRKTGAWVAIPKHGGLFARWDEMEKRRLHEGEEI